MQNRLRSAQAEAIGWTLPITAAVHRDALPGDTQVRWGPHSQALARDLHAVGFAYGRDVFVDLQRFRPGTREGNLVLGHELEHVREQRGREPELALLTEAEFRRQLGATPEQAVVIDALFANPRFLALWNYLGSCPVSPAQDHGPIALLVTPGLRIAGVERFGGYSPMTKTLEINPTKAEHRNNPQELVDTIVHEVIHAVSDVESACVAAGAGPAPLGGAATATLPSGLPALGPGAQGPGASDPCGETIDINVAAQSLITRILTENMQATRLGMPTLTFLNEVLRADPAARSAYLACRGIACGLGTPAQRAQAIARCSTEVLGAFMSGTLLPSRVLFDFDSSALRPDAAAALDLVAAFLRAHAQTHVNLVGHADPVGNVAYNRALGQRRAEAVAARLIASGVSAGQIEQVSTRGELERLSTRSSEHFQDRRVEIIPFSVP